MSSRLVLAGYASVVLRLMVLLNPEMAARGALVEDPLDATHLGEVKPHIILQPTGHGGPTLALERQLVDSVRVGSASSLVRSDGVVETRARISPALALAPPPTDAFQKGEDVAKVPRGDYAIPGGPCPAGAAVGSADECRAAAAALGAAAGRFWQVSASRLPSGCSTRVGRGFVWNTSPRGATSGGEVVPVCRKSASPSPAPPSQAPEPSAGGSPGHAVAWPSAPLASSGCLPDGGATASLLGVGVTCCNRGTRTAARPGCRSGVGWAEAGAICGAAGMELCTRAAIRSLGTQGGSGSCPELDQMAMWISEECIVGQVAATPSGSVEASIAEVTRWAPTGGGLVETTAEGSSPWMNPAVSAGGALLILFALGAGTYCMRTRGAQRGDEMSAPLAPAGGGGSADSGATPAGPASG